MARLSRELKIGIYFIVIIVAVYWGINFLKGRDIFGKVNTFYSIYDNVEGLQVSSHVFMKGLKVGMVESIEFDEKSQKFKVTMRVQSHYNIPINSVAHLYSADIMGNKAIKIAVSTDTIYLNDKAKMASVVDTDFTSSLVNEIIPLKQKAEKLIDELNVTFNSVNNVLDSATVLNINKSIAHLSGTLANFEQVSKTLANDKHSISSILGNIELITSNLKENNSQITSAIHNISSLSDTLANLQLASTVNELHSILTQVNSGKGTIGKLATNDSLYNNLSNTLVNMNLLLKDLREHPKRYVNLSIFGNDKEK